MGKQRRGAGSSGGRCCVDFLRMKMKMVAGCTPGVSSSLLQVIDIEIECRICAHQEKVLGPFVSVQNNNMGAIQSGHTQLWGRSGFQKKNSGFSEY